MIATSSLISTLIVVVYIQTGSSSFDSQVTRGCFANLCNETADYPYEQIKQAVEKYPEYKIYFGTVLSIPEPRYRRGIVSEYEDRACQTERGKMLPRAGVNIKRDIATIVNIDEFKQEVPYLICLSEKCQQKYKLIELVVLSEEGDLSTSKFPVPAGCRTAPDVVG